MPSNTTYYNLWIFDPTADTGQTFFTFRTDIAGVSGSSNFVIIDTALHTHDTQITALQNVKGVTYVPLTFSSGTLYTATGIVGISSYVDGMIIDASLSQDSTGTTTININTIGTVSLLKYNSTGSATVNLTSGDLKKNKEYLFRYSTSAGAFLWVSGTSGDQVNVGGTSGNLVSITSTGVLQNSGISYLSSVLPDGYGINYQITSSISSNNLVVALKGEDGNDPSATNPIVVRCGNAQISLTSALSVTITAAMGDIFAWDAGKIQANDAQLFVYFINNNGTAQLGLSPSPVLTTVANNYYDGSQTGATGHTNIVMSTTRNATNSCRVIGRLNVNQQDNNNWQNATTALVINTPIFKTDYMTWTPTMTVSGAMTYTSVSILRSVYMVDAHTCSIELCTDGTTGGTASNVIAGTLPITAYGLAANVIIPSGGLVRDGGVYYSSVAYIAQATATQIWTVRYDFANLTLGASRGPFINTRYEVS